MWLWVLKAIPGVLQAASPQNPGSRDAGGLAWGLRLNLAPLQYLGQCGQLALLRVCKI